jgi:hypothetical protein
MIMKTICVLLLAISAIGCGYSSKNGMQAGAAPAIAAPLMPNVATANGPAFMLTVNGSHFVAGSMVYWNSVAHATTFRMSNQLTTMITAADIANTGNVPVYVLNPGGTGIYMNQPAQRSNTVTFTVQ